MWNLSHGCMVSSRTFVIIRDQCVVIVSNNSHTSHSAMVAGKNWSFRLRNKSNLFGTYSFLPKSGLGEECELFVPEVRP